MQLLDVCMGWVRVLLSAPFYALAFVFFLLTSLFTFFAESIYVAGPRKKESGNESARNSQQER